MKKIINGKRYDTETAKLYCRWSNRCGSFDACDEALYKTKSGAYFLAGSGGAKSKYAETYGNGTSEGHGLQVITEEEAIEWLERHDGTEVLEQYFACYIVEG